MRRFFVLCWLLFAPSAFAVDYHGVGWFNTFVPGGGEFLLGNTGSGLLQAGLETSTFGIGYALSKRTPLTLDGVPEELPTVSRTYTSHKVTTRVCTVESGSHKLVCRNQTGLATSGSTNGDAVDLTRPLVADWLQEFGIKYHMVNVFNAYRASAGEGGGLIGEQGIDPTPTSDLFLAPFRVDNLTSAWVYPAILVTAAAVIFNYQQVMKDNQLPATAPMRTGSQRLYDTTYIAMYPNGSAAPEEMFYRGFLQHEMYGIVPSPFFSIAMSSLAFAFSHSTDDRLSAGVSGAYLGIVAHAHNGGLAEGIAYHFWSDVITGFYQVAIVRRQSGKKPIFQLKWDF